MSKTPLSLEEVEPALFWFSRLETARREGDPRMAARAEQELERLGIVVRIVRPIHTEGPEEARR